MPLTRIARPQKVSDGLTLAEVIATTALVFLLVVTLMPRTPQIIPDQKLDLAISRLAVGLTKAMRKADSSGSCSIRLSTDGWEGWGNNPCLEPGQGSINPGTGQNLSAQLRHNIPAPGVLTINPIPSDPRIPIANPEQRILIAVSVGGTSQQRCLVLEPGPGLIRIGRYQESTADGEPQLNQCIENKDQNG